MRQFFIALALLGAAASAVHAAEYQYVSDKLVITLRNGQGNSHQILKTLPTGTRLEVLESTDEGYSRVRTSDGTEGWVRSQYLMGEPTAAMQLDEATRKLNNLQEETEKLRSALSEVQAERAQLATQRDELLGKLEDAESRLDHLNEVAARPIVLDKENRELQQKNVALEKELQILNQENQALKDRAKREWFIAGAGVLLGGLLLGLLIPRIRWRKQSSW
ncbi:TIGR04211 family SH3 domain-containing protein [Thiohalophilus sp.]|uniref:TIGR04211 family SH3 domain-containing protein n=1 Tax=Thiohalophilus sp. TaxID=3028392 RepID=UPI002ACEC789|nr:TIGR04211 family SH3 domain-containing protein [Thiohalophilus sp.]MDZ7803006.1 TIGR04211 family SH3 domain-containing protein [Thiohalophilus sp.]